ncbi:UNVERIFIED_CONTAM: hypothetical protein GTU68_053878 [Idotea baltica]|nr:hypothetical protein [Idotea baltica]
MIEVDRVMIEDLRIELIQMMENAGRNLAQLVIDRFAPGTVTVLAGSGGNGGGGLVAARHLANRGVDVAVTLGKPSDKLGPVTTHQYDILRRMGVPDEPEPRTADVVIDALVGYSLKGAPRGRVGELVEQIGQIGEHVVALDTPSGVNVTDGSAPGIAVDADATMTLALPKIGLRDHASVGELYLADISVPPSVYTAMGVAHVPDFSTSTLVRVDPDIEPATA